MLAEDRGYVQPGLISTQKVAKALNGNFDLNAFKAMIGNPKNQLRRDLAGQMIGVLLEFLERTNSGGRIYAALYELTDAELIASLIGVGDKLDIVMAEIVSKPIQKKSTRAKGKTIEDPEENAKAWKGISASANEKFYRLPPESHIVHNKFLIYVDEGGEAQAVLTGSTNWTATGLCAQTNNTIVIDDALVARRYLNYWTALKKDQQAQAADPKAFQGAALRAFNARAELLSLDQHTRLTSYFSPNTPKQRGAKKTGEDAPVDMKDMAARIAAAKQAVLFLAFIPGTPSVVDFASAAQRTKKDLFVRGCVTAPDAAGEFYYTLHGTSLPKRPRAVKGQPKPPKVDIRQDPRVIAAAALTKADAPKGWVKELLKAGFAITHDKIVVIDPFADDCTVITGSHNLGYQASFNNDENLIMIQGDRAVATAYATHVLDVYDHFSWRWALSHGTGKIDEHSDSATLKSTPDDWLDRYFDDKGNIKTAQLKFWMQATV